MKKVGAPRKPYRTDTFTIRTRVEWLAVVKAAALRKIKQLEKKNNEQTI